MSNLLRAFGGGKSGTISAPGYYRFSPNGGFVNISADIGRNDVCPCMFLKLKDANWFQRIWAWLRSDYRDKLIEKQIKKYGLKKYKNCCFKHGRPYLKKLVKS